MAALQYVDVPGYSALILRRTFPELRGADGLLVRAQSWLTNTDAYQSDGGQLWTFPSGATLRFGHCQEEKDRFKYDGQAYQFVGFDELTSFTETQYDHIGFTRMSRSEQIPAPLRTRGSCTPIGVGYGWVKKRFISQRQDDVSFVPARVRDNPGVIAAEYEHGMERVPEALRKRLLEGDWEAFEGAAFGEFNQHVHLIPDIQIPSGWERFESMDFGIANPTCVLAWAVDYDGNCVVFDEYYERDRLVSQHAQAIEAKREVWGTSQCYADPSMWSRTGATVAAAPEFSSWNKFGGAATDVTEFEQYNILGLLPANNNRRAGRSRVLELLHLDEQHPYPAWHASQGESKSPRLYIVASKCPNLVEQIQAAPVLAEDSGKQGAGEIVDPDWESAHGHAIAALRYGAMSRPTPSEQAPVKPSVMNPVPSEEELRAEAFRRWRDRQDDDRRRPPKRRTERV